MEFFGSREGGSQNVRGVDSALIPHTHLHAVGRIEAQAGIDFEISRISH